ncbi:hypothetical protein GCM10018783_49970 [Streptomyces griseosporeus]|nr:hypothetical protein GCM10018783_49970 [Streptomyces griseosporeus]
MADVIVDDAGGALPVGVVFAPEAGLGERGRVRVFGIHREGFLFLGGQALAVGWQSPRGPSHVWDGCVCVLLALSVGQTTRPESSPVGIFTPRSEFARREGGVGLGGVLYARWVVHRERRADRRPGGQVAVAVTLP